ncbi:hypothetical protein GCM10020254_77810 [Streptomyces goshikiensis]
MTTKTAVVKRLAAVKQSRMARTYGIAPRICRSVRRGARAASAPSSSGPPSSGLASSGPSAPGRAPAGVRKRTVAISSAAEV